MAETRPSQFIQEAEEAFVKAKAALDEQWALPESRNIKLGRNKAADYITLGTLAAKIAYIKMIGNQRA